MAKIASQKHLMRLANGSDVRGVAVEGVADEPVNLTTEAANRITSGFVEFLAERTGLSKDELRIAVGHDSRISAHDLKHAVLEALTCAGVTTIDCGLASTPAMFMSTVFPETKRIAVINNADAEEKTDLYIKGHLIDSLTLAPREMRWVDDAE